ncbi:MAG: hypothetical protein KDB03_01220 [Planctomycetales bacterium]|nr:hypothetical protein [Planctomycetales bacterium]
MRRVLLALALASVLVPGSQALAFKQIADQFKGKYAGDEANADFKELVKKAGCNVCHVKGEDKKKVRNPYGNALHEALEEAEFPVADFKKNPEKYAEKLKEIMTKVEEEKCKDEEHKTFGARIKANLLPGGDVDGK